MKNGKKLLSLLLVGSMALSLAACGDDAATTPSSDAASASSEADASASSEADASGSEAADVDLSERVDLVFYVAGDAPTDELVVEEAINEKLLEKLNATVDFQFTTWTDFQTKYSNELLAGTPDLIYIANWFNYGTFAKEGAFLELDELLPTYAPKLTELCGTYLDQCKVDGAIYAVPAMWPEYVSSGITYREDLRAKYDLPVPNSIENLEAYLLGIQENEPNQGLLLPTTGDSTGLSHAFDAAWILNFKYPWVTTNGLSYGLSANADSPSQVYDYWFSDDFVDDMKLMKKWAGYGFWSKSALSDTNDSESFKNGLCVASFWGQNPAKCNTNKNDFETAGQGWEAEYVAFGETTGVIYPGHATQNGTAIVRGCENPERALMVLEYFMTDEEMYRLVQYGIEGTHYQFDENGYYQTIMNDDGTSNFGSEAFNTWNLRNAEFKLGNESDERLQKVFDRLEAIGAKCKYPNTDIAAGFTEVYDDYAAERTAISNVMRTYLAPLQAGLVDDVDAAVEEFRTKVNEAGREKVVEAYKAQWAAYCESMGYE